MTSRPTSPARPRRLAIVRLTSLGDVIHTLPLAAAIKQHEPAARIVWLAEERERVVLDDNPVVDEVIVVPLRRWRVDGRRPKGPATGESANSETLRRALRELKLDAALDVQGLAAQDVAPRVALARAAADRIQPGVRAASRWRRCFTTARVTPPADARHIVDQNLALLGPLGIPPPVRADFPFPAFAEAETRAAESWWRASPLRTVAASSRCCRRRGAPPSCGRSTSFHAVASRLVDDPNIIVLALGGPGEEARLNAVVAGLPAERAIALAPGPIPHLVGAIASRRAGDRQRHRADSHRRRERRAVARALRTRRAASGTVRTARSAISFRVRRGRWPTSASRTCGRRSDACRRRPVRSAS